MPLIIGYHGCDLSTAQEVLGGDPFKQSNQDYDWLGPGTYFWEDDPLRAYQWATEPHRKYPHPCLVGAVILKGKCLDLTTQTAIEAVEDAYKAVIKFRKTSGQAIPTNSHLKGTLKTDRVLRRLDCAVINQVFDNYEKLRATNPKIETPVTVRALFPEGKKLYAKSGFLKKTHIQICVRDPNQILGVFRLPDWQRTEFNLPAIYQETAGRSCHYETAE